MASATLDAVYPLQPPRSKGGLLNARSKGRSEAWKCDTSTVNKERHNSMAPALKISTGGLENCVDLTSPQPMENVRDPVGESALGFGGTENAQGSPSVGPQLAAGGEGVGDPLPSLEELLRGAGVAQEPQRAATSVDHGSETADGAVDYPTPRPSRDGDEREGSTNPGVSDERGGPQADLGSPPTTAPDSEAGPITLREKTNHPTSGPLPPPSPLLSPPPPPPSSLPLSLLPPPPLPPPPPLSSPPPRPVSALSAHTALCSISETHTESGGSPLKDIRPDLSNNGKEKAHTGDGHIGDNVTPDRDLLARGVRASSKRTVDKTGFKEVGEGKPRLKKKKKVRRTDPINETDSADHDRVLALSRSQPKPVFKPPPPLPFYHCESSRSSIYSSLLGNSQDNPVMLEDDSIIADEYGAPAKAASVEPQIEPARTLSSDTREEPKAPECVDASPDRSLGQHPCMQVVGEVEYSAETAVSPPRAPTPSLPQGSKSEAPLLEQEEWEIRKIIDKRRLAKKGFEYKVRWKDTWLRRSELGNAQRLILEFEAQDRAQHGRKQGRPAHGDNRR